MPDNMTTIKLDAFTIGEGDHAFKVDAIELTVSDEHAKTGEAVLQILQDAAQHIGILQADNDRLEGERDTLQKQVTDAQDISPEQLHAMSEARRQIIDVALHVGFKKDDLRVATDADIKAMVVRKDNEDTPKEANTDYLDGCFGMIQKRMDKEAGAKQATAKLGEITRPQVRRSDSGEQNLDANGEEKSYRDHAMDSLVGAHSKSEEELLKGGLVN